MHCGECCMDPSKYSTYHIFEKNLTKATTDSPCSAFGFTLYDSTVTHGFGPIKMTLDLYDKPAVWQVTETTTVYTLEGVDTTGDCAQISLPAADVKSAQAVDHNLNVGQCSDVGYSIADGTTTKKVPVLGSLTVLKFKKSAFVAAQPASLVADSGFVGAALFEQEFRQFKATYGKVYASAEHEAESFVKFVNNLDFIRNHKGDGYSLAINEFADMTHDEFKAAKLGYKPSEHVVKKIFGAKYTEVTVDPAAPASIDWVAKGAVTPVKNQAQCGSCWAFSTTGSIEGAIFTTYGVLESLSEQELVSCDKVDSGCQGGAMDNGFTYAETNGLATEDAYPYTSGTGTAGTCSTTKSKTAAAHSKVISFTDVTPNSETALLNAVAKGPVSVAIEADQQAFQFYSSGIIKASAGCGTNLDHGVLAVGYGEDNGLKYWKVKNSWGPTWGDDGYVRLERTVSTNSKGTCGIAMDASFPKV